MKRLLALLVLLPTLVFAEDSFDDWVKQEMKTYHVVGASIAVINQGKIKTVKEYGFRNKKKKLAVNKDTVFSATSISQPITAIAVLKTFVEKNLSLTANINDVLTAWHLPENEFNKDTPVTVSLLLEHSAGISGFHLKGYKINSKIPNLIDVLNGTKLSNTPAIVVVSKPGTLYEYSPAGFTLIQQALVDIYVQPFAQLMRNIILVPFGMTRSTFVQPLPETFKNNIALPYLPNGKAVPKGPLIIVSEAAGGLYTTPTDLAKFIIKFQTILHGTAMDGLNPRMLKQMLMPRINPNMGLGMEVNLNKYGEQVKTGDYFGHSGFNSGYITFMLASQKDKNGLVVMLNTAPYADAKTVSQYEFMKKVIRRIADDEKWQ